MCCPGLTVRLSDKNLRSVWDSGFWRMTTFQQAAYHKPNEQKTFQESLAGKWLEKKAPRS